MDTSKLKLPDGLESSFIGRTVSFNIGQLEIEPTYWQVAAIVFLLFALVWTLARLRHMYVDWSLGKSSLAMLFWGFLLTLILEGFLLIGGRTLLTEVLGWKNAPKPIGTALDVGREKLVDVLGVTEEIPQSMAKENPTPESIISDFQTLTQTEVDEVREFVCE